MRSIERRCCPGARPEVSSLESDRAQRLDWPQVLPEGQMEDLEAYQVHAVPMEGHEVGQRWRTVAGSRPGASGPSLGGQADAPMGGAAAYLAAEDAGEREAYQAPKSSTDVAARKGADHTPSAAA